MNIEASKEILETLKNRKPLQSLLPNKIWNNDLDETIENLSIDQVEGLQTEVLEYVLAWKSGLHLWNDSLTKSHTISQNIINQTGSYWHAIMHRLEPDYSNAKYWFKQVGMHPVYILLQKDITKFLLSRNEVDHLKNVELKSGLKTIQQQSLWNSNLFIDLVEIQSKVQDEEAQHLLENIQHFEMMNLLSFTYNKCCGGSPFESF